MADIHDLGIHDPGIHDPGSNVQLPDDPAGVVAAYCATFATGSGELLDHHYEPGAVLVPHPGHPVTGADRVAAHRHLLGFGLPIDAPARRVYVAGDVALLIVDWSVSGTARQGHPVDLRGTATDVARRGADGRWRYVIDNPFGTT
jgi:ketosteroid isomerase-like protein